MADFYIKKNDRAPALLVQCIDENNEPVPLTAAISVKFHMINPGTADPKIEDAAAVIVDVPTGMVRYDWTAGDTDTEGKYNGEFEVAWSDGTTTSFPNFRYIDIEVVRDIS